MPNKVILVTGGVRSGKSRLAEELTLGAGKRCFYLATAPVFDDEMADRVRRHRERRAGQGWTTIEEELDLGGALRRAAAAGAEAILVDCLTLWINNLLYDAERRGCELTEDVLCAAAGELCAVLRSLPVTTVLVINEVGLGIVPESPLARRFRDLSGRCGQLVAAEADEVYFTVVGIARRIK